MIAIKYNDGSKDTGHIMLVDREPQRMEATSPVERGTEQYRVEVIDSSASGHGPTDTRHKADGGFTGGIGKGAIRLYANREGAYRWLCMERNAQIEVLPKPGARPRRWAAKS